MESEQKKKHFLEHGVTSCCCDGKKTQLCVNCIGQLFSWFSGLECNKCTQTFNVSEIVKKHLEKKEKSYLK